MTIVNIHMKDEEKKKLQEFIETHTSKSMSEFIRRIISDKMRIEELLENQEVFDEPIEIPDYIPKNKYVIFVKGAVVAVGDNPSDLADIAITKFPNLPFTIKYNGNKKKTMEYVYMSLKEFHAWKYSVFEDQSYPIIPIELHLDENIKSLSASIDTASTLCVLKEGVFPIEEFSISRKESILTAGGVIEKEIYDGIVKILDSTFNIEFIIAPIPEILPFKFLVGRNLLDKLDAYFMGKKQVLLIKLAE